MVVIVILFGHDGCHSNIFFRWLDMMLVIVIVF